MKPPVTRLVKTTNDLSNGVSFTIVHQFSDAQYSKMFKKWLKTTKNPTALSFIKYVKRRHPFRIFVSLQDFEEITRGNMIPATKEEYEAENN